VSTSVSTSFEDLVAARAPALLRTAVMLTGNRADAEDLLQTTLLQAHRHRAGLVSMGAPAAYLRRILVNAHLQGVRARARRPRVVAELDDLAAVGPEPPPAIGAMWQHLTALPTRQRAVLVLRYYEDLPDREIAEILGCGQSTVRSTAFRALATLRERLADLPPEEL
jgi:RNA polymerase sigma-70 factor (sigma-E family)